MEELLALRDCTHCGKTKPEAEYYSYKQKSALFGKCKTCHNEYTRQWQQKNKEKIKKYSQEYYIKNKEIMAKHNRKYKEQNRERIAERKRNYYRNNTQERLVVALRRRIWNALNGIIKSDNSINLLGCTIEELKVYLESQFKEGMTWDNWTPDGWHIDHIKPCASFDLTDPEQQKECFHYSNLQPLWAEENLSKNSRVKHYY